MKKIAVFMLAATLAFAGCSKNDDTLDAYASFKANATPRWENGATVEKNESSNYEFIIDADGKLFSSAKYKTGRTSFDGSNYELIEFNGAPMVGKPAEPTLRKPSGTTALASLEIVKIDNGKLWIVFKETATSTERRVVQ